MKKVFSVQRSPVFLTDRPGLGQDVGTVVQRVLPGLHGMNSVILSAADPLEFSFPSDAYARHLLGDGRVEFLSENMLSECVGSKAFSNQTLIAEPLYLSFRLRPTRGLQLLLYDRQAGSSITWYFSPSQL